MGLFGKIKNILFEEEEVEVPTKEIKKKEKLSNIIEEKEVVKEEKIEKAKQVMEEKDSKDIFEKEPSFNFPDFDEDEFENTLPKFKEEKVVKPEPLKENKGYSDFRPETRSHSEERKREDLYKRPETKAFSKPISLFSGSKKTEVEPVKKFTPSPIISPVYGILDKDYHPSQIKSKDEDLSTKRYSKIDVDTVRKKAFEPKATIESEEEKIIEPEEIKPPVKEEAPKKSLDELLADSAEETIAVDENLTVENNIKEIEDELDKIDEDLVLDEKPKERDEDDTLEQDLFELIDSMYEDKKEDD